FLGIAGKDKVLNEKKLDNQSTSSPVHYFVVSSFFVIMTIWLLTIFHFLYRNESYRMKERMRLYGVTELQQISARIFVTLLVSSVFAIFAFILIAELASFELYKEDVQRLTIIFIL